MHVRDASLDKNYPIVDEIICIDGQSGSIHACVDAKRYSDVLSANRREMVPDAMKLVVHTLALCGLLGSLARCDAADGRPAWQPPAGLQQVPIWPVTAPGMADVAQPAESAELIESPHLVAGRPWTAIHDVVIPTMTVFSPKGRNTGAAMVVFPGGGFQILAIDLEGTEICDWMTAKGITCVLLKYRVPNSAHHWDKDCHCHVTPKIPRALQDAQRTIRLVRSRATELHVDPHRIGVIGFSAGGYLVAETSNIFEPVYAAVDAADQVSSRPDFAIALYPGHICREGNTIDPGLHVTEHTPPTFLLHAWDDPVDDVCESTVYARALEGAGVPAEIHLFAHGGHAFGLRRTAHAITRWPALVEDWLSEIGVVRKP